MGNSMLMALALFFAAWIILRQEGNHGLWLSFIAFLVARALILQFYYEKEKPYLSESVS